MLAITQLTIQNTEISYFLKLLNMGLKLVSSNPQLMVSYNHYGFAITIIQYHGTDVTTARLVLVLADITST